MSEGIGDRPEAAIPIAFRSSTRLRSLRASLQVAHLVRCIKASISAHPMQEGFGPRLFVSAQDCICFDVVPGYLFLMGTRSSYFHFHGDYHAR